MEADEIEVKTRELTGYILNWAASRADTGNKNISHSNPYYPVDTSPLPYANSKPYRPDEDGTQLVDLMSRWQVSLDPYDDFPNWAARVSGVPNVVLGATLAEAVLRCVVVSALGETITIPRVLADDPDVGLGWPN